MFGNKAEKNRRLQQELNIIRRHGRISQAELARLIGHHRSVVQRDVIYLQRLDSRLYEDAAGWLCLDA